MADYFNDIPCRVSRDELEHDIKSNAPTSEQVASLFEVCDDYQPEGVLPDDFPTFEEFLAMTPEQQDNIGRK